MAAKKAPAKPARKRPAKKKTPSVPPGTLSGQPASLPRLIAFVISSLGVGIISGVLLAGGIRIGGSDGPDDSLSQSHANDRASQVRILREFASKEFASEPDAMKWLNEQRIAARPGDWIPYTDELGEACDSGPEAVKALADRLEGKR